MTRKGHLMIDIGSTYFKVAEEGRMPRQYFRDFTRPIHDDLMDKAGRTIAMYPPDRIHICSSANGGLSTLIIGLTRSFSLKYAVNTAYNAGINIIDTLLWRQIEEAKPPAETIDVVILVGGIDGVGGIFDERLVDFLQKCRYQNIVYVGSACERGFLSEAIPHLVIFDNILDDRLKIAEKPLKTYLTDLYQADIMGKEDIKQLYAITDNQIFATPYIVNQALPLIGQKMGVADPFIVIDIGGATTDIHYSTDLIDDNLTGEGGYDRLVFKKLGVYKSRPSLVHAARANEFVFELLHHLGQTEHVLDEMSETATKVLMQLAIFLILYKVSGHHTDYVDLKLDKLNTIVLTGGITQILSHTEAEEIIHFFYKKLLHFHQAPQVVMDSDYRIWTYGLIPKEVL